MAETYSSLIERAAQRLSDAMGEAAADALVAHQKWGKPLATVCKEIATQADTPNMWKALEGRAIRLRNKALVNGDSGVSDQRSETAIQNIRTGRSAIKRAPELAGEMVLDPEVRNTLRKALADHDRRQVVEATDRDAKDPVSSKVGQQRAVQELQSVLARHADSVTDLMVAVGALTTKDAPWLMTALERSEAANRSVRYYVEHGESELDAGIRELAREA